MPPSAPPKADRTFKYLSPTPQLPQPSPAASRSTPYVHLCSHWHANPSLCPTCSLLYAGLKSCPQLLMQCASSTANSDSSRAACSRRSAERNLGRDGGKGRGEARHAGGRVAGLEGGYGSGSGAGAWTSWRCRCRCKCVALMSKLRNGAAARTHGNRRQPMRMRVRQLRRS